LPIFYISLMLHQYFSAAIHPPLIGEVQQILNNLQILYRFSDCGAVSDSALPRGAEWNAAPKNIGAPHCCQVLSILLGQFSEKS
jgi:hypothetical protein